MKKTRKAKTLWKTRPVELTRVRFRGGFWEKRLRVNRTVTIPIAYEQCRSTGRIDAFRLKWKKGDPDPPHIFWDSDVAKWIEAAAYSLATRRDPALEKKVDHAIDLIARAQRKDGYLNIHFTVVEPKKRWTNLRDWHELYCAGHLIEAAVAYHAATGKSRLLDVLCRYADYIGGVFGRGRGQKRGYPGHEEIELALIRLYRATAERRYLDLAKYFIDERGRTPHYFDIEAAARGEDPAVTKRKVLDYFQAHLPVREQTTAEGHAVRWGYLFAGAADVAAETGDRALLAACRKVWRNVVERRMYIHGGIGSTRQGERFTLDHDLPNEEAYAETCAAIALIFFAHRMLQIDPDRTYADTMERALYNNVLSGVSLDGKRFFYDNYLASQPGVHRYTKQKGPVRKEWFGCACCPPNLARLLASLGRYAYSTSRRAVYVHLFVSGEARLDVGGRAVTLVQETEYPWDGQVRIALRLDAPAEFALALRVPGWCRGADITVNGRHERTDLRKGYAILRRRWQSGDRIEMEIPMPVETVRAHPAVRHDCGRVALQRGPVVYCLEEKDNGKNLNDILLPEHPDFEVSTCASGVLRGMPVIATRATRRDPSEWKGRLYRLDETPRVECAVTAIPYFAWANRDEGEMLVWIRQSE
ncbi:glycoside hydrolase family 127 protein [Candidatus Sumerlaeota bacterium]|nr:glycoside hydrolase family 127 protein [Candidatus Sumerlaeota bacterium]